MKKINAGYEITDFISVEGQNYVLAHHPSPKCPEPYVVWQADAQMDNFWFGHYFSEKSVAIADMIQRSTYALERPDGIPLAVDFLTDNAREALESQMRDKIATETIKDALEEVLEDEERYPTNLTAEDILKNPDFAARARYGYDNVDHSEENYAMRTTLEDILYDHPEFLRGPVALHAEVRISPELNALIQDILSMPTAAVPEKYGPLGDNIFFYFSFEDSHTATLSLIPACNADDSLSETEPHKVLLSVKNADQTLLCDRVYTAEDLGKTGMTGVYEILKNDSVQMTLDLEEDETLRRVGNQFTFRSSTETDVYKQHDGELCTVQRTLTPKECDILCCGLMYEAQFSNGDVLQVFDDELEQLEPSRKPALGQMISDAHDKISKDIHEPEGKSPER